MCSSTQHVQVLIGEAVTVDGLQEIRKCMTSGRMWVLTFPPVPSPRAKHRDQLCAANEA
jgi:hypothetical protein